MKRIFIIVFLYLNSNLLSEDFEAYKLIYDSNNSGTLENIYSIINNDYWLQNEHLDFIKSDSIRKNFISEEFNIEIDKIIEEFTIIADTISYKSQNCSVFYHENNKILYYFSFDKKKIIKEMDFSDERHIFASSRFLGVFNDDYEFDFYILETGEKISSIDAENIITSFPIIVNDKFVMGHSKGISIYNIYTRDLLWKYPILNIKDNRIIKKDKSHFYFQINDNFLLFNIDSGDIINEFSLNYLDAQKAFIGLKSSDLIHIHNDTTLIIEGIVSGDYRKYNSDFFYKKNVFYKDSNYYYFSDNEAVFKVKLNDDSTIEYSWIFDIEIPPRERILQESPLGVDLDEIIMYLNYPEIARIQNLEGRFVARVLISNNDLPILILMGSELDSESDNVLFYENTAKAILMSRFQSAEVNNKKIKAWVSIPINFYLDNQRYKKRISIE